MGIRIFLLVLCIALLILCVPGALILPLRVIGELPADWSYLLRVICGLAVSFGFISLGGLCVQGVQHIWDEG